MGGGVICPETDWYLPDFELAKARSYLDWVGPALLRHPDAAHWRERLGISEASSGVRLLQDPSQVEIDGDPARELANGRNVGR